MKLNLSGAWKVTHIPYRAELDGILSESFVPEGWLTAQIPEEIHATLRRAGAIRGNTYNKREDEELWIEQKDWVYWKAFHLPAREDDLPVELTFEGLDTFCEIWLNGKKLGFHQNMHTPCTLDATDALNFGGFNRLVLRFFSPVRFVEGMDETGIFSITTSDRMFARKAQMNYNWDFCARCVTVGIWKPVTLESRPTEAIEDYYLYTESIGETARMGLEPQVRVGEGCTLTARLSFDGETVCEQTVPAEAEKIALTIENPKLWWPRPYGEQPLYDFELTLERDGEIIDRKTQRVGVRTIEILREDQPDGRSFQFCVNGRKLFIRGANWVPVNTVYTDITEENYRFLIHGAIQAKLSMLRIWGGGIYEPKLLFELCDEAGILLWSDFMFSCGIYPRSEAFLKEVAVEAEHAVRMYRNFTCLAIWAGDNECGQAYIWAARRYEFMDDPIANVVLKEACERLDPHRFYLTTSPGSPDPDIKGGDNPESPYQGDLHLYIMSADPGVNSHRDYGVFYYKRVLGYKPRFMSEFGFISLPEKDSYYRFNAHREPFRNPEELLRDLPMVKPYIEKGDMASVIHLSQLFNSMALKYWIEYFRSLKGTCAGTLYWKFNDPMADSPDDYMYPSQMSSIDMYGNTKMSFYFTRRCYDDILVAFIESIDGRDGLSVHACNELLTGFTGTLRLTRRSFSGRILAQQTIDCSLPADSAVKLCTVDEDLARPGDRFSEYLKAEMTLDGKTYENRYFFADINEIDKLVLPKGEVKCSGVRDGNTLTIRLTAGTYLRCVRLSVLDVWGDYSDNCFDMDPGETREITVALANGDGMDDRYVFIEGWNLGRTVLPVCEMK